MSTRRRKIDRAAFLVGATRWLHQAGFAVELGEAAIDSDRVDDIRRKLLAWGISLLHPPAALGALGATALPGDKQADQLLTRVLGGLAGTTDVLGVELDLTLTRIICFVDADQRSGSAVTAALLNLARAGNTLNTFYRDVRIEAVFYWLTPPSDRQIDEVFSALGADTDWGCEDNVDVMPSHLDVNGDLPLPMQPEDYEPRDWRLMKRTYTFVDTAVVELLAKAEEATRA